MLTTTRRVIFTSVAASLISAPPSWSEEPPLRRIALDGASRTSAAVIVPASTPLVHTGQILPLDSTGAPVSPGRAESQAKALLDRLEHALGGAGSGLDRLIKVDIYAARPEAIGAFRAELARRLTPTAAPAISFVVGALAVPGALLALDAVAANSDQTPGGAAPGLKPKVLTGQGIGGGLAILPAGRRVFISGQADPGADLAQATRRTLEKLDRTLADLNLDRGRVVRLKAFFRPMGSAGDVEREIRNFFGTSPVPPVSFVEWRSTVPIEIELIAAGGPSPPGAEPIEYLTPPGLKPSPVFSRVARVNGGPLIYVSGLYGPPRAKAAEQVEDIFTKLGQILKEAGGDFRHLAKATYYVSDDEAGRALNELRPRYYDPARPPAASKATVAGIGAPDRSVSLDMIAVAVAP